MNNYPNRILQEAALVRKYYNDRGRESIDWAEAEAYQNRLQDAQTGTTYLYLPHSLWKKHVTSSRQKGEKRRFEVDALEDMPNEKNTKGVAIKRFSTEYDTKVMKAWAKHSNRCGGKLTDPVLMKRILDGARTMAAQNKGYSNTDPNFQELLIVPAGKKKVRKKSVK